MSFLLDTDHISILQRQSGAEFAALSGRMAGYPADAFALSVISFHEQVMGGHAYINRARAAVDVVRGYGLLGRVIRDFSTAPVLPFDTAAAAVFDGLAASRSRGSTMDLRIAAIALARGLTLLTRNVRHFAGIPGLLIEDWTMPFDPRAAGDGF